MGDIISGFLSTIPQAAANPLALVAYIATLIAWAIISLKVKRNKNLLEKIEGFPEGDRKSIILAEMGHVNIPRDMTAEQYIVLASKKHLFNAFLVACALIAFIIAITSVEFFQKRIRSDNLISALIDRADSNTMSAINVINNGPQMVAEAAAEIGPEMTNQELSERTNELVQGGIRDPETIIKMLADDAGTGRLNSLNDSLSNTASTIDGAFSDIADCYLKVECRDGSEVTRLCQLVNAVQLRFDAINEAARSIGGVSFNASDSPMLFGDAPLNLVFNEVSSDNVSYLRNGVCDASD